MAFPEPKVNSKGRPLERLESNSVPIGKSVCWAASRFAAMISFLHRMRLETPKVCATYSSVNTSGFRSTAPSTPFSRKAETIVSSSVMPCMLEIQQFITSSTVQSSSPASVPTYSILTREPFVMTLSSSEPFSSTRFFKAHPFSEESEVQAVSSIDTEESDRRVNFEKGCIHVLLFERDGGFLCILSALRITFESEPKLKDLHGAIRRNAMVVKLNESFMVFE
mmetsp:Transcript_8164/g.17737  ORF Transcript_8164/g.17737 Transcript_8164/m.17737 type:complete len:223 (-) Transcript_8164:251-919(-)